MVFRILPNLSGSARFAVLDDEFRRDGRVFQERLRLLFLAEFSDALDSGQSLRAFERLLVVPVVVEPRNARSFVFRGGQWRVRRIRAGDFPPDHRIAEVDEASFRLGPIPCLEAVSISVNLLPHQAARSEPHFGST